MVHRPGMVCKLFVAFSILVKYLLKVKGTLLETFIASWHCCIGKLMISGLIFLNRYGWVQTLEKCGKNIGCLKNNYKNSNQIITRSLEMHWLRREERSPLEDYTWQTPLPWWSHKTSKIWTTLQEKRTCNFSGNGLACFGEWYKWTHVIHAEILRRGYCCVRCELHHWSREW